MCPPYQIFSVFLRFFPFFPCRYKIVIIANFGPVCPVWLPYLVGGALTSYMFAVAISGPCFVVGRVADLGGAVCRAFGFSASRGFFGPCLSGVSGLASISRGALRALAVSVRVRRWQAVRLSNKCPICVYRTNLRNKCSSGFLALSEKISNRILTESDRISEFFQPNPDRISDRI